eukprot:scaffold136143_cov109-Phaeocystis_antarctica.AAC.1
MARARLQHLLEADLAAVVGDLELGEEDHLLLSGHDHAAVPLGREADRLHHAAQQRRELLRGDEAVAVGVEPRPLLDELLEQRVGHDLLVLGGEAREVLEDDGDDEVEHDEGADEREEDEVDQGGQGRAAGAGVVAAAVGVELLGDHGVVHDAVPALAGDAAEEQEVGLAEGAE